MPLRYRKNLELITVNEVIYIISIGLSDALSEILVTILSYFITLSSDRRDIIVPVALIMLTVPVSLLKQALQIVMLTIHGAEAGD